MKKLLSIVLLMVSMHVFAQTNPITSINISLPANPDANTANWGTGTSLLVITASCKSSTGKVDPNIEASRILVIIKKDGKKVYGSNTGTTAPLAYFNGPTKVWSGKNAAGLLGGDYSLSPGDYELSVQFFGTGAANNPIPMSDEKIKPFTIKGNDQQAYQPPQAVTPADGSVLKAGEILKPVTFRWTPVIPKPQEPVTYRLKVWQLMQGQSGPQAIKVNQPIITKDVDNLTQAIVTDLKTGPCKPPYLCDFVWNVQALNRDGKPIGGNNGTSGTNEFNTRDMGIYSITVKDLLVECHKGADHNFTVNVGNPNNGTAIFDRLEVVSINGTVITPIPATTASPAIGSIIPANGSINVSASFSYASAMNVVCVKAYIKEQANPLLNVASSYTCDTLKCCWPCDINQVTASNSSIVETDPTTGQINIQNIITATPNNITKIVADLVYVKITSPNNNCNPCNKDKKEQDNFINRNFIVGSALWKNNGNGTIAYTSVNGVTRSLTFTSTNTSGVNIASGIKISHSIGLSPTSCCVDAVEVWIRYSVWDNSCHVCDQLVKATLTRNKACTTGTGTTGTEGTTNGKIPVKN